MVHARPQRYESGELDKPVTPDLTHASLDSTLSTRINIACLESNTLNRNGNEWFNVPLEVRVRNEDGSQPDSELCSGYLRESVIYFVFVVNGGRMHEGPAPGYSMARFWHIRVFSDFISTFFKSFCTNDIHTHHLYARSCFTQFL